VQRCGDSERALVVAAPHDAEAVFVAHARDAQRRARTAALLQLHVHDSVGATFGHESRERCFVVNALVGAQKPLRRERQCAQEAFVPWRQRLLDHLDA